MGLQKTIIAQANANSNTNSYKAQMDALQEVRGSLVGNMAALDQYRVRQGQVLTAQDAWQKKIKEGKATFGDLIRNHKMFGDVLKDQIALQRSMGIGWTQSSKTGKFAVDQFIPTNLSRDIRTARAEIGLLSNITAVASDNMVKWGKNTQWAGRQLMVGFTVPLGIAAAATGKLAYDMDKAITQVVKVYGDATSGIQESTTAIRTSALETASAAARIYGQSAKDTLGIMADLAASGKSGQELQQATMATTRAAILGELDWQDAVKATISMQEVYHASQEDLANNWNYINAMENQTVLSAQDFVTAIPKVSGVMNTLGADLKQTGALLAAFKAAGIDAAEGANALKSINFRLVATYGKGLETFQRYTGKDLKALINETNGETIPSLTKFAEAIKDLSAPDKVAVTRDVFGIYQGSKAMMLLDQMTQKTEQWTTALKVAQNTNLQNAAIAQQELDRQSERPFKQLDKAVETLKINLSQIGEVFLAPAAKIVEVIGKIVAGINNMNPIFKTLIGGGAILVGLAGPIIMLVGLIGNLTGSIMKGVSNLGMLVTGFKMLTVEERMQQIASSKTIGIWDAQTSAAAALNIQLSHLNQNLARASKMDAALATHMPFGPMTKADHDAAIARTRMIDQQTADNRYAQNPLPAYQPKYKQDSSGKWYNTQNPNSGSHVYPNVARLGNETGQRQHDAKIAQRKAEILSTVQAERAERELAAANKAGAEASQAAADKAAAHAQKVQRLGNAMTMAAVGAGVLGTALGMNEGVSGIITNTLMTAGTLGMLFPKIFEKIAAAALFMGGRINGVFAKMGMGFTGFLKYLKVGAPIFAAVALAGIAVWQHYQKEIDAAREKAVQFNNYAKTMADVLGYTYNTTGQFDPNKQIKDGKQATIVLAEKFKKANAEAADAFSTMKGKDIGEQWGAAIAAGVDAKMHGATVEQARDTARVAMQLMGKTFDDAEFNVAIDSRVNFDDFNSMLLAKADDLKRIMTQAMADAGANGWEAFFNAGQLSQVSGENVRKAGEDFWTMFFNADVSKREDMLKKVAGDSERIVREEWAKLTSDADKKGRLAGIGINNAHDFSQALANGVVSATSLGMDDESFDRLKRSNSALNELARSIALAAGVTPEARKQIFLLFDLFQHDEITNGMPGVDQSLSNFSGGLYNLIDAGNGVGKAFAKLGTAYDYLHSVADGAPVDAEKFNESLQTLGYQAGVTLEALTNMYKGAYSGAQNSIFAEASAQFDDFQTRAYEAKQKELQKSIDDLDAEGERLQKSQEKAKNALDKQHDADKKNFDKSWDAREKRENAYYDNKIKAIDKAIEAEQKAEEIRQRIFEAEKTRIQRLSQLFSDNIDINMAINSGNLDEAAKLSSNSQAQVQQWAVDDQMALSGDASKNRIDNMQKQKDSIEAAKKARLEALEEIKKKDEEVLQNRIDRENDALKATQETARKEVDARKKAAVEKNKNDLAEFKKTQDAEKKRLDQSVEALKATLPKTQAEYEEQGRKLQEIYKGYLGQLKVDGTSWATFVSTELTRNMNNESAKMHSNIAWDQIGKQIAEDMLKGAFNMNAADFAKFINGGSAPNESLFGKNPKPYVKPAQAPPRPRPSAFGGRINDPNAGALHTGGPVTMGGGGRVGKSGELKPTEVNKTLLVGEGVVNRRAMRLIGKTGLDQINSGGGMGGGATLGMGSVPAAFSALTGKMLIQKTMQGAYDKAMGRMGTYVGSKSGVQGPGLVQTVQNIAGAVLGSQPAYKSGRVVYLGHGSYTGGANLGVTARPADGRVVSEFGPRNLLGMTFHNGIDIANAAGTPIKAAARGRIVFTGWDDTGYGNYVQMQAPDGTMFGYGHNSTIAVRAGQQVFPGQIIARMGSTGKSTGPHSHFQTGRDGKWFNPRALFPQLKNGGFTMNEGLANLHPKETVITAPLTEKFKQGVDNFANSGGGGYNVTMNFAGAHFETTADIEQAVLDVHYKLEKKRGVVRKVGQ